MTRWRILDGQEVVQCSQERWEYFLDDYPSDTLCRVALTQFPHGPVVSTIFLLYPMFSPGDAAMFGTQVFTSGDGRHGLRLHEPDGVGSYEVYTNTYQEAQAAHARVCTRVAFAAIKDHGYNRAGREELLAVLRGELP